ncbi:hypothetical protein [Niveibacterium terrae]|uniref:hypothetical protein n=1 Tax=Niveibacterium terrae TaxID=3373598 RepID=UPI003A8E9D6E
MNRKVASLFVALFCFSLAFSEKVLAGESDRMGNVPDGRPMAPKAVYSGVRCDRLVSVFVESYIKAGFSEKKRKKYGNAYYVFVDLEFGFDGFGVKGGESYSISYPREKRSCSVIRTTGGPDLRYSNVGAEKLEAFSRKMEVADRNALLLIRSKLGKSPVCDCGSVDNCSYGMGCW